MDKAFARMGKAIAFFAALTLFTTPMVLLGALPVMLALGVAHNEITTRVPALGFWATFLLLWGIRTFIGTLRATGSKE